MSEIVFGRNVVREVLHARRRKLELLYIQQGSEGILKEFIPRDGSLAGKVRRLSRDDLDQKTRKGHHQGVAAVVSEYPYLEWEDLLTRDVHLVLALDSIQDPQNTGAILRSAEAFGVGGVLIPKDRACPVTPAVVRASSGAAEHLRVALVTNLARVLKAFSEKGYWVVGSTPSGGKGPSDVQWSGKVVLVVGSEGEGMRQGIARACDEWVTIPMRGKTSSLNVSVAAGVLIYEIQRRLCTDRAKDDL